MSARGAADCRPGVGAAHCGAVHDGLCRGLTLRCWSGANRGDVIAARPSSKNQPLYPARRVDCAASVQIIVPDRPTRACVTEKAERDASPGGFFKYHRRIRYRSRRTVSRPLTRPVLQPHHHHHLHPFILPHIPVIVFSCLTCPSRQPALLLSSCLLLLSSSLRGDLPRNLPDRRVLPASSAANLSALFCLFECASLPKRPSSSLTPLISHTLLLPRAHLSPRPHLSSANMRLTRSMVRRYSSGANSTSSASTSPERGIDDDNDSLMLHDNDSQSSLALSLPDELSDSLAQEMAERCRVSPISRLPAELMIAIFQKLGSSTDLQSCMLVSREWARNSVGLLWHRPQTQRWEALHNVVQSLRSVHSYYDYAHLVKRLNLSSLGVLVSDGTLQPFKSCKRVERLTLTNCTKLTDLSVVQMVEGNRSLLALDVTGMEGLTDRTMFAVANNCFRLQGLNITHCRRISDDGLAAVARSCRHLKRVGSVTFSKTWSRC